MDAVRYLTLDHKILARMSRQSYVTSLVHAISRMRIDDEQVWASLGAYLAERADVFSERDLSTQVYSLMNVSRLKPIILNFDDIFRRYELLIIKRFDQEGATPQSISNTLLAYSKTQNGSQQFFRAMESFVLQKARQFSSQELANIIYTYYRADNALTDPLLIDLRPIVMQTIESYKPVELCQVLRAYTEAGLLDEKMIEVFAIQFNARHEEMNPEDCATFYECFTKAGFAGPGKFYKYLQKSISRTIRAYEGPHLRMLFYNFDNVEECRLNRGVRGRLEEHCRYLIKERKLSGFDANEIF